MVGTYYIRLPFYLINGTEPKNVNISFDNSVVSSVEVTATDRSNMNTVTFSVSKEPAIYQLKIMPDASPDQVTTVCLDDIWVSNDNITFYSVLLNYGKGTGIPSNLPDSSYGFDPVKGACLYSDFDFALDIDLLDSESWNNLYKYANLDWHKADLAAAEADPAADADLVARKKVFTGCFEARGYN